jgi:putative inorganic carbon (HCO3(-)) transporter
MVSVGTGFGSLIPLLLYVGAIVACLGSIFWRPHYGLYYLIPLLPMQTTRYRLQQFPLGEKMVDVLLLCIGIGVLLQNRGQLIPKTPMNKLLALLGVVLYASLWRGSFYLGADVPLSFADPRVAGWINYMVMPLLCLLVVAAVKDIKQMKVLVLLIVFSAILVNYSFFDSSVRHDLSHFSKNVRDAGVLGYAGENGFSAFVAGTSVFLVALYSFQQRKSFKIALAVILAYCMYCLLYSFSRGAYLSFLLSVVFLGFFRERKLVAGALALVIGWQVFLPNAVQERITMTRDDEGALESSSADRVILWQDAWQLFWKEPIFGTGFDTYEFMHRIGTYDDTHNYYLKVMVETGVVGLMLFLWLLAKAFRMGFRLFRSAKDPFLQALGFGVAGMIVCTAVANFFGDRWTYLQVNCFLWTLLGFAMRGQMIVDEGGEAVPDVP